MTDGMTRGIQSGLMIAAVLVCTLALIRWHQNSIVQERIEERRMRVLEKREENEGKLCAVYFRWKAQLNQTEPGMEAICNTMRW